MRMDYAGKLHVFVTNIVERHLFQSLRWVTRQADLAVSANGVFHDVHPAIVGPGFCDWQALVYSRAKRI